MTVLTILRYFTGNLGQNIWRLFQDLAQFSFTASKTELDCYHQKLYVQVASGWLKTEWLKTWDLRKLGKFKKIPEMLGTDSAYPTDYPEGKFWQLLENYKQLFVKPSIEKLNLLNFVNLWMFCPILGFWLRF